jgi:hypothetical protein
MHPDVPWRRILRCADAGLQGTTTLARRRATADRAMRARGELIGLFSFDLGFEIDLERARALATEGRSGEIERRRAAPQSLAYAAPPLRIPLGTRPVTLQGARVDAAASATLHDFGAATIVLEVPLDREIAALPAFTAHLVTAGELDGPARALLDDLVRRIAPAIVRPEHNSFFEDYYVLRLDPEHAGDPATLVDHHAVTLASALRGELQALSAAETAEVLANRFSYYPSDLVVTDWNVALIVDRDYADAVSVLEVLNVQLVELRYHDARLDALVASFYGLSAKPLRWPLSYRPYRRAVDELGTIRLDVATLVERVHNALKLSGSLYLAKIYARTSDRLGLGVWEASVARKLDVLQEIYDVAVQRTATARAEALEMTIIVLIAVEIAFFLAGWS